MSIERGERGGQCNRKACGAGPATYYNHSTQKWYCRDCAWDIQDFENTQKNPAMIFSEFWKEPTE